MTTLRVLLAAPPSPHRADAWGLFDAAGNCVRDGVDRPAAWPAADNVEFVLAAAQLRIASVKLPPMPASRVAGAAGFALDDQLAGPAHSHQLAASRQAPDGRVRVVVVARALVEGIARDRGDLARIVAEPELATPIAAWRWCAGESDREGFIRCPNGSAFPVDAPPRAGALPAVLTLALAQARREGAAPAQVRVDAACTDGALEGWQRETGIAFVRGTPWRWQDAGAAAFAEAIDVLPGAPAAESAARERVRGRVFAPALWLAGAALAVHLGGTVFEWASLRLEAWRGEREWASLAATAGIVPDAATGALPARAALAHRYAELRHAHGLPAPDDALPLLARAAPALSALPPGVVRSATYADGHWTLDLARADAGVIAAVDGRMRAASVPVLVATSAAGARLRFGGP